MPDSSDCQRTREDSKTSMEKTAPDIAPTAAPLTKPLSVSWPIKAPVIAPNKVPTANTNVISFSINLRKRSSIQKWSRFMSSFVKKGTYKITRNSGCIFNKIMDNKSHTPLSTCLSCCLFDCNPNPTKNYYVPHISLSPKSSFLSSINSDQF